MAKRGVPGPALYFARNVIDNERATGDVENHTVAWVKDGVAAAATNAPFEVSAVLAPGWYCVMRTAAESDCILGVPAGTSSTEGVELFGVAMSFDDALDSEDVGGVVAAALATYGAATDSDVPSAAEIVTALYVSTATSGGASFKQFCDFLVAMAKGKFTSPADNTYTWYADDDVTALFTLVASPTGRTSA
jgi:hypothetical protein